MNDVVTEFLIRRSAIEGSLLTPSAPVNAISKLLLRSCNLKSRGDCNANAHLYSLVPRPSSARIAEVGAVMTMAVNIEPEKGGHRDSRSTSRWALKVPNCSKGAIEEVDEVILPCLRHTSRQKRSAWRHSTFIFKVNTGHNFFLY